MKKNFEIKILKNCPFSIFEIRNLFSRPELEYLANTFPEIEDFPKSNDLGKYFMDSRDDSFRVFIRQNLFFYSAIQNFDNYDFFNLFFQEIKTLPEMKFVERFNEIIFLPDFYTSGEINLISDTKLFFWFSFEFSSMIQYAYLPPHTDSTGKVSSVLIYLPKSSNKNLIDSGTNFFIHKKFPNQLFRNWESNQLKSEENLDFYKSHNIFFRSKFKLGSIVGFLKSDISWHSVEFLNSSEIRNSFNISLFCSATEPQKRL